MADRQLDILATNPYHYANPRYTPGRLSSLSFVHFSWGPNIDPARYTVAVESMDTAGPTFRSIGKLDRRVELPHVKFPWECRIFVLPDSDKLPSFDSVLQRGAIYKIPMVSQNGMYSMTWSGSARPSGL
jgi:hypothetical protein